ncbi:MAG: hypothetical protein EOP06_10490, partial [Proteobacteria bacterium]
MKNLKIVIGIFFVSTLFFSCNEDDSKEADVPVPDQTVKPRSLSYNDFGTTIVTRTFTYDEHDRMATLTTNLRTLTFVYDENNRATHLLASDGHDTEFVYGTDGRITNILQGDNDIAINYGDDGMFSIFDFAYGLDANGDWKVFVGAELTHGSGLGAFANVKSFDAIVVLMADYDSYMYGGRKRLLKINDQDML